MKIKKGTYIKTILLLAVAIVLSFAANTFLKHSSSDLMYSFSEKQDLPPNILIVFTDDVGWGDATCYNPNSKIPTPNIDKLAADGIRFTHAHSPAALCAPTRYSMLTGNYPWRGRSLGGTWGFNKPSHILPGQKTIVQILKPAGYRSAMFGKAGLGGFWEVDPEQSPTHTPAPIEWGFDYSFLIPRGHQSTPYAFFENGISTTKIVNDSAPNWDPSKIGETLLSKAISFLDDHIENHSNKPFYIHFCTDGAHAPFNPAKTLNGIQVRGATNMTNHTDMVYETDVLLGALLKALEERNLRENTLVVYTSDNGGLPLERHLGHDAVAGLRGQKKYIFEGGHRVIFVASWPKKIPQGLIRNQVIGTHDIIATAIDFAGLSIPENQILDAVSLAPVLLGEKDDSQPIRQSLLVQSSIKGGPFIDGGAKANGPPVKRIYEKKNPNNKKSRNFSFAIYDGDWKLVLTRFGKPAALFDLQTDLGEEKNLINKHELQKRIQRMAKNYSEIRNSSYSTPR